MQNYRPTKAIVDLGAIKRNVEKIISTYPTYQYRFGVVKGDCYGLRSAKVVKAILDAGANYLCVSLAEEALELRKEFPHVPILIFVPVPDCALAAMKENNIDVSVATLSQAKKAAQIHGLNIHIRANGGSDLFGGPTTKEGFEEIFNLLKTSKAHLKGIYLHNYDTEDKVATKKEYDTFEMMTSGIDLKSVEIVNIPNSLALVEYDKKPYANGFRMGNIIYGFENDTMELENCFSLVSRVMEIVTLSKNQTIAYSKVFQAKKDNEKVAVIPIGYADGFAKENLGRDVFINSIRYKIVAVTMDITLVLVDETVMEEDEVVLIKDTRHIDEIAQYLHSIAEESVCLLNKRVPREYIQ